MSAEPTGRLGRRLARILSMLPYAIQNPGVSVGDLASRFGVPKEDVMADLQLVFLCGLPGYGPGDLIDVAIDDDRIYVGMADYFAAPLRLTPAEALTLYAGASALTKLPGFEQADSLERALTKLGRALGADEDSGIGVRFEPAPEEHLQLLEDALTGGRKVRMEYLSASRGELTDRVVHPWGLVAALGRWYLVADDESVEEERMFRVDRIKSVTVLDEAARVPDDFDPERYRGAFTGDAEQDRITLEISPAAARWFEDYYPVLESKDLEDGWRRVTLIASSDRWTATLMLRLGRDCRAPQPSSLFDRAHELAAAIAARHG